jgi:alkyl sulfatase BDS1-like metallo-beta-lactamase superfamily hydrolase
MRCGAALVKRLRDLEPEALIGYAHRPIVGKDKIRDSLNAYLDGIAFTLDQTLRHILGGYGPEELRHLIRMPEYLDADPHNFQSYGELSFQAPAIFYHAVGWYDGDAATIFRPSPREEAERIVALIGGRNKVLEAAKNAYDAKEYAWSAQLVKYLFKLDPADDEVRRFKARVLRQLAYLSTGANARSHLISQALTLEGKITVPRLVPPQPQFIAAAPERSVDYFRIRIDPEKSGTTDKVVRFEFTDGNKSVVGLHIRRAVAEYLPDPEKHYRTADLVIALTGQAWARLYLSQASVQDVAEAGELHVAKGTVEEVAALFEMFDRYSPEKAVLVAPHLHEPG